MKIIHISIYPPKGEKHATAGGVASYTKNLITNIPYSKNDQVFVLTNKLDNKRDEYIENGIKIIRCFDKKPKFFWQILKEVRKINPDTIHIQQELALFGNVLTAYLLQWLLVALKKYNLIITLHGVVSLEKINKKFIKENNSNLPIWLTKIAFRIIYKPLCLWSDKIIVHEEYFKNILIKEYKVDNNKIETIYHGVEDFQTIDKEDACKILGINPTKDICLFMGYLTGYKGIDLLIEGFSEYAQKNSNTFLIIGAGKHPKLKDDKIYLQEYKRLQGKAEKMIPKNQYKWVGFIDEEEIGVYYSASDVSIYPYTISMSSSGPMAIAIGYQKPFIASDVFKEVLPDKFIFQRNEKALSKKIEEFFHNQEIFQKEISEMKNNRLWTRVGQQTFNIYKNNL
jgi:glycosyltransferase involved in cell wall biosynthesis